MSMTPKNNPSSSEYLPENHQSTELTPEQVVAQADLHDAWDNRLYGSLGVPESEQQTIDAYHDPSVDIEELQRRTGMKIDGRELVGDVHEIAKETDRIVAVTTTELDRKFDLGIDDGVEVSTDEALTTALAEEQTGRREDGVQVALAKEIGLQLEGADTTAKKDILERFRHSDDAARIVEYGDELRRHHGTIEAATSRELERLGSMIESAPVANPKTSDVVVTEDADGAVHVEDEAQLAKQEEEKALEAARRFAQEAQHV